MADKTGRPATRLAVLRTERLSDHFIRVVAGGAGLSSFVDNEFTDQYVKLLFPVPGVRYPEPFDMATIRAEYPRTEWPTTRTYTVRYLDREAAELAIDFVYHGDEGLAGPWAAAAKPGDELLLLGPGGSYAPDPAADWHLLVGDESALPAIAAALAVLPAGAPARVLLAVDNHNDEVPLSTEADARVQWLHRASGDDLVAAVRALDFPDGAVQAFVHGEAGEVRELRGHLFKERQISKDAVSISGYWRQGRNEDRWQAEKKEFFAAN